MTGGPPETTTGRGTQDVVSTTHEAGRSPADRTPAWKAPPILLPLLPGSPLHNVYVAGALPENLFRSASEEDVLQTRQAMARHNDQVYLRLFRIAKDFHSGFSAQQFALAGPQLDGYFSAQCLQFLFCFRAGGLNHHGADLTADRCFKLCDMSGLQIDMDNMERGAVLLCQVYGKRHGSLGIFDAKYLIRFMQANAKRFDKFGA